MTLTALIVLGQRPRQKHVKEDFVCYKKNKEESSLRVNFFCRVSYIKSGYEHTDMSVVQQESSILKFGLIFTHYHQKS